MTLIDQRIIIDAPPHVVWEYISDPDKVRRWHTGYRHISVLTTQQAGLGTRRRCTLTGSDKDVIEEITAWVDGLGYEYAQIEGGSYKSLRARLRLQAVPDGTSVQWTVTYQPRGIVGRLRDLFGGKRDMQRVMADSLRSLRRQVDELGLRMGADYRERVSMRGRLSHEERQEYLSRSPGAEAGTAIPPGVAPVAAPPPGAIEASAAHIAEPSPSDLVPPEVPVASSSAARATPERPDAVPEPAPGVVPSFVGELLDESGTEGTADTGYDHTADTEPKPPQALREALASQDADRPGGVEAPAPEPPASAAATDASPGETRIPPRPIPEVSPLYSKAPTRPLDSREVDGVEVGEAGAAPGETPAVPAPEAPDPHSHPTPPHGIPSVRAQRTMRPVDPGTVAPETAATPTDAEPDVAPSAAPTPPRGTPSVQPGAREREARPAHLPPPTPKTDTGEISIWEVFGEQRPSEQDSHALEDLIESVTARETAAFRRRTRWAKRPARVRHLQRAVGLRLRLALRGTQVRVGRALRPENQDGEGR